MGFRPQPMSHQMLQPAIISYDAMLTSADYVAARRLNLSPRPVMRLILWWWVLAFAPVCLWLAYFGWVRGRWHPLLAPIGGATAFLALYLLIVLPWNTR